MLRLKDLRVSYSNLEVLHGLNMHVEQGETVALIGANGAGKSTTLKAITGLLKADKESSIEFMGEQIHTLEAEAIVERGISLSPEGRHVFPALSVLENLEMGAYLRLLRRRDKGEIQKDLKRVFSIFPRLEERKAQLSRTLSGGEQQMLAIARALMARPKLLMLDEPSTGLAPLIVRDIFNIIRQINQEGTTILLVEQNAKMALSVADRGYVLKSGEIILTDTGRNLLNNDAVRSAYLGESLYIQEEAHA